MNKNRADRKGTRISGFSLFEVVVALAIAGLGLAALMAAAGQGLGNAQVADRTIEATRRAQSHLAEIGVSVPLVAGVQTGDDGGGYSWRLRIAPPLAYAPAPQGPRPPALFTVEAAVSWQSNGQTRTVALQSQKLGQP